MERVSNMPASGGVSMISILAATLCAGFFELGTDSFARFCAGFVQQVGLAQYLTPVTAPFFAALIVGVLGIGAREFCAMLRWWIERREKRREGSE